MILATILSSFPPLRGMSKYTAALVRGLPTETKFEALGFKRMYPKSLYPTDTVDDSLQRLDQANIRERSFMTWYNPLTWLYAGFTFKGQILHVQWWHFFLTPMFATVMLCAKLRGRPVTTTVHNVGAHELGGVQRIANSIIYALTNQFIVHTDANKLLLQQQVKKPVQVVQHGILAPDIKLQNLSRQQARQRLNIEPDEKVALFFGIIRDYKGLDVLIEAFADVTSRVSGAKLIIAGKPWTGESWSEYEQLIRKRHVEGLIIQKVGFVPEAEIEPLFVAADVVVFPYKHFDAQSGAASMALYFGRAMVVSKVGGLPNLVKDQRAVVPPNDGSKLAEAVERVLTDSNYRNELEGSSRQLAKELSWQSIGIKTAALYAECVAEN